MPLGENVETAVQTADNFLRRHAVPVLMAFLGGSMGIALALAAYIGDQLYQSNERIVEKLNSISTENARTTTVVENLHTDVKDLRENLYTRREAEKDIEILRMGIENNSKDIDRIEETRPR